MKPQAESREPFADVKATFAAVATAAAVVAFPVVLCTTRLGTWGSRYLGFHALLGFFWPLLLAGFFGPRERTDSLVAFWWASIVLLLAHRIQAHRRRLRGEHCHSRYCGRSWFERADGGIAAQRAGRATASLAAIAVGLAVAGLGDAPLGALFAIGGCAKLVADALAFQAVESRLRQMEDARQDSEYYHGQFRERRGWD